ncbi:MAG: formyltransferase [Deltaproteobacteria bacterium]|nr:formyltransferase [Deltaproteobacteria bacterium]
MKVVVFAYHNMGITGLEALKKEQFDIKAVISHHDNPEENCWFGSVVEWAKENGISVYCPANVNSPEWIEKIQNIAPDVIFSFYYRNLLSGNILDIPPSGAYNLHGSLLPAYRGRCPVNWVLVNGESSTGVTLHHMAEKADAGDIVGQREVPIEFEDTAFTLYGKLCGCAKELLSELLPLMKNATAPRIAQDLSPGNYYGGRQPEDGRIDWNWPVLRIYNLIRAVTDPYPGAFTLLPNGEKLLIWWGRPEQRGDSGTAEGTVEAEGKNIYIRSSDGQLKLIDIEIAHNRLKGQKIFDYFKRKKGMVLK